MNIRHALSVATIAVAAMSPSAAMAQSAWVPPKGEVAVSTTYQWLVANRHLFSDLTGPELTPMEIAMGTDFQSNSLDIGTVQSHAVAMEGDVGITDQLALSGAFAFIAPKYVGAFPENLAFDDGAYHATVQDIRIGARYRVGRELWSLTPFTELTTPIRDYEILAHAAAGLGLTMVEIGASVGRILLVDGAAKGYVQGGYGYAFVDSPFDDIRLNRSRATLEGGYFFGRLSLQALTSWRQVHGGIEWSDLHVDSHQHFAGHDQAAATREWRYYAGASLQLTEAMSIEITYGDFIQGANTHAARSLSIGWTFGFQAFGAPTLGGTFR